MTVASDLLGSPASWMSLADDARRPRTVTAAAAPAPRQTATATATSADAVDRRGDVRVGADVIDIHRGIRAPVFGKL